MGDSAHTTHHTSANPAKNQHPTLFLKDENIFQKSATLVRCRTAIETVPTRSIFEKCSHLREIGGVLMLFENDPPFINKGTVVGIPRRCSYNSSWNS